MKQLILLIFILSDNIEEMETLFHSLLLGSSLPMPDTELGTGSSVKFSHLVMSDSLQPYGLQHARPSCP